MESVKKYNNLLHLREESKGTNQRVLLKEFVETLTMMYFSEANNVNCSSSNRPDPKPNSL